MLAQENPEIEKAYGALQDLSNDEVLRHEAQQREMYLQNEMAINEERYEQGVREGKEQGVKEGIEKGKEQGIKEGKIGIAVNLLSMGLPLQQISDATGLLISEIKELEASLDN